jgi:hypothetical protein
VPIYLSDASNFFADSLAKLRLYDSKLQSGIVVGDVPQTISTTSRLIGLSISPNPKASLISPMACRQSLAYSLDQLQRLWQFIVLYINSMLQPREDVGLLILEFVQSLQAISRRIVSLRPEMSFVRKYCLRWTVCVEDCLTILATGNEFMSQNLFNSVTESMLVSAQEIPEIVVAVNQQLGPLMQNEETDQLLGPSKLNGHQVRSSFTPHVFYSPQTSMKSALADLLRKANSSNSLLGSADNCRWNESQNMKISTEPQSWPDVGRARKRLRLSSDHELSELASLAQSLCARINKMLTGRDTSETDGLSEIAP